MKITFWGIRGSHPAIIENSAYGNHTSCVEVTVGKQRLIFDAGTGINSLGQSLMKSNDDKVLHLFFTHYHLDHVLGLLNFQPVYQRYQKINFYGPTSHDKTCEQVLKKLFDDPYHPIALANLPSKQAFKTMAEGYRVSLPTGEQEDEPVTIETIALNHPGGALGYKVTYQKKSFAYITDVVLGDAEGRDEIVKFIEHVDLVVTDTTYSNEDYEMMPMKRSWGHSSWEEAVELVKAAKAKRLVLFHLDPNKDDRELNRMLNAGKKTFSGLEIIREEESLELKM